MALYYKIKNSEIPLPGIQAHQITTTPPSNGPSTKFDFSKHVLIELLDNFTPEEKLWEALGLADNKYIVHKRLMIDSHRIHCRRAIVICISAAEAKNLATRVSQTKIIKRCVCAVVVQELLSDLGLFEKQILNFGDDRSQQQLVYVTDFNRCRQPSGLAAYLREKFSVFGTILSVFVAEDNDGYAYPEGVIKFAYLSEAFAAELAYDQLVVGMERLSVTTHHNILLTQCDLRVRLRETLRTSLSLLESNLLKSRQSTTLSERLSVDKDSLIASCKPTEMIIIPSLDLEENFNQTKTLTLENNAESFLLKDDDKLICISNNNKDNKSNKSPNKISVLSLSMQGKRMPSKFKETSNVTYLENFFKYSRLKETSVTSSKKERSSKINDCMNETLHIRKLLDYSVISNDNEAKIILDSESTNCSFVSSNDGTHSKLSKGKPAKFKKCSDKNTTVTSLKSLSEDLNISNSLQDSDWDKSNDFKVTVASHDFSTNSMLNKKKNLSLLSSKLSLKSQRQDSQYQIPDSKLLAKNTYQLPVLRLKRLTPTEIKKWTCGTSVQQSSVNQNLDDSEVANVQEALLDCDTLNTSEFETESPLRIWLKEELHYSSNNRVTGGCLENSKKVVYPTTKQDILVSVGCSHMTCSSCYPSSTNLLFGFR